MKPDADHVLVPLVVAGILVENDAELIRIGVCDSKQLTPKNENNSPRQIKDIVVKI